MNSAVLKCSYYSYDAYVKIVPDPVKVAYNIKTVDPHHFINIDDE